MNITYAGLWQNWQGERGARQFVQEEMRFLLQAEELGFDMVLIPEHHFDQDYSAVPDNFLPLTYVAARTERIKLCLGAVIIPWNTPLRVVEKFSLLDHLSNGRCQMGFGRGLSKLEYGCFGLDMEESRGRFLEGYEMIVQGIRTGTIEGDGPFFPQPRADIVPVPRASLADSVLNVGMSPDSAVQAGSLASELLLFMTQPIEATMPLIQGYCERYTETTGQIPPPPTTTDYMYVHEDATEARRAGLLYAGRYFQSVVRHYSFDGTHFADTKGYEQYAESAKAIRDAGMDAAVVAYVDAQAGVGTPEEVIAKYRHRLDVMGPFHAAGAFFYGGMSVEECDRSTRLFASEVAPELRKLFDEAVAKQQKQAAAVA
jgi:alkanesulfonate monooxygenase SsuD/methylene tetrahydromethanopterin reductase-like flavin-dependent oxidoreductase (luciferase family)